MKITKTLLVLLLSITIFSCDSDDGTPIIPVTDVSGDILGTWEMIDLNYTGSNTVTSQGQAIPTTYVGVGKNIDNSISFTENPNDLIAQGTYDIELTSTTFGQTTTQTETNLPLLPNSTWSKNGTNLILTSNGQDTPFTILELSGTTLKLQQDSDDTLTQQGITIVNSLSMVITFIRVN